LGLGWSGVDKLFTRVRLVHISYEARRSEIMIIYAMQVGESSDLVKRALQKVSVSRR
jgi:hypothetical protein